MTSIVYYEDKQKLKIKAIKFMIGGLIALVLGACIFVFANRVPGDFSTVAYMTAAFRASGTTGCAIISAFWFGIGSFIFTRLGKPPILMISADESGVTLPVAADKYFIGWQDIVEIRAVRKSRQDSVVFILHNPDAFTKKVRQNLKALIKNNAHAYGSPAVANVTSCAAPKEQIANELNQILKSHQRIQ